jgi:hypothetical protein
MANRGLATQLMSERDERRGRMKDAIDAHNELRSKCYELARENDGELMGTDAWLRNAMSEGDMTLDWGSDGVHCRGLAYTSQTWDHEPFAFTIPWERILD